MTVANNKHRLLLSAEVGRICLVQLDCAASDDLAMMTILLSPTNQLSVRSALRLKVKEVKRSAYRSRTTAKRNLLEALAQPPSIFLGIFAVRLSFGTNRSQHVAQLCFNAINGFCLLLLLPSLKIMLH